MEVCSGLRIRRKVIAARNLPSDTPGQLDLVSGLAIAQAFSDLGRCRPPVNPKGTTLNSNHIPKALAAAGDVQVEPPERVAHLANVLIPYLHDAQPRILLPRQRGDLLLGMAAERFESWSWPDGHTKSRCELRNMANRRTVRTSKHGKKNSTDAVWRYL